MFIAIDGIDGSGKTTLARQLTEIFQGSFEVFLTKEPTGYSSWGQRLRRAAVDGRLPAEVELEHFKQDRNFHIQQYIIPALESGKIVISDRYVDSTLAFQTSNPDEAEALYQSMLDDILVPDVTFIIDCPVDVGLKRIDVRDNGKLSQFEKRETLEKASSIYRARTGDNYVHLDGSGMTSETFSQAINALKSRLDETHPIHALVANNEQLASPNSFISTRVAG